MLFLQGLASPFLREFAKALIDRGHGVHKINFCWGDKLFWRLGGAFDFRDCSEQWPTYLARLLRGLRVTDVVMFADGRPLHRVAIQVAQSARVTPWVLEEGYVRPNWITLEMGGTNANSSLSRRPCVILAESERLLDRFEGNSFAGGMARRVRDEVLYHVANFANFPRFRHYRHHRPWPPTRELLAGWLPKLVRTISRRNEAAEIMAWVKARRSKYFFLPLQLEGDYQIRIHSPFGSVEAAIEYALESFANHATADTYLLIKIHPLDNGMFDWRTFVNRRAKDLGIVPRVLLFDGGHLPTLLRNAIGVVTVNSTVGMSALTHNRPVCVLGRALYDVTGLTHQGALDSFWMSPVPPDMALFAAFRRLVIARTQLNGSFYTQEGIAQGVREAVDRIERAGSYQYSKDGGSIAGSTCISR